MNSDPNIHEWLSINLRICEVFLLKQLFLGRGKVYYLTLKASIILSWFHERTEGWEQGIAPTREIVNALYVQDYDLYDTFVIVAKPWEHIQASWYRSKDCPRVRAYMLFIVYKAVREIHQR